MGVETSLSRQNLSVNPIPQRLGRIYGVDNKIPKADVGGKDCIKDMGIDPESMPDTWCRDIVRSCRKRPYTGIGATVLSCRKIQALITSNLMKCSRVCLKIAFWQMCVTICGRFEPNEGRIAGYVTWIWLKYTAKWGVHLAGMNFQTRSSTTANTICSVFLCELF